MSPRPTVDVVVPFFGSREALVEVLDRFSLLDLGPQDTLTVVDNRPASAAAVAHANVLRAPERQSPAHARNAGARRGSREWILFLDADVEPPRDIADQYFAVPPGDDVAVLAGEIHDQEPPPGRGTAAARYMFLRRTMSQHTTRAQCGPFAKTANAAVRRVAFEAVGGFREELRSGEDVDLCYRLRDAGWQLEFRDDAPVEHQGRESVRALLIQHSGHGAGAAWLDKQYPGFSPPYRWSSLVVSLIRGAIKGGWARLRGDRDRALIEILDPMTALAFHLGRLRSQKVD